MVETFVAYFKLIFRNLLLGADRNYEKPQDSRCTGRGSNWTPPEYKTDGLRPEAACSVAVCSNKQMVSDKSDFHRTEQGCDS
jgi:hypothetical protein